MKAHLMNRDRDFDAQPAKPWNQDALVQDLALMPLVHAMARGDEFVQGVAMAALLAEGGSDRETILYRQAVARDALSNAAVVRQLYDLSVEALEGARRRSFGMSSHYPSSTLYGALDMMQMFVGYLRRLRDFSAAQTSRFGSEGFRNLFAMLERELAEDYVARIEGFVADLRFRRGALVSAELGPGNVGRNLVLRKPRVDTRRWLDRLFHRESDAYTYRLPERDEAGAQSLSNLRNRGIHLAATALAQSADHVESFFRTLRAELAFFVGCSNLHEQLASLGVPTGFPDPASAPRSLRFRELSDPCLALETGHRVVGSTAAADGKDLVVITGANRGGKSTFLRSIGVAQLMMQSGMFVAAEAFEGETCRGVVTHFKREEDVSLESGK
ncbi:MAG TPA: DNA mismatch repair protein MutS, partial [Thermoanaerobaculia bacterium]